MTPRGSFHGSNRETWLTSGRFSSTPIHSRTPRAVASSSGIFLGLSGSMAGSIIFPREIGKSGGTNEVIVKTAASKGLRWSRRNAQTPGFGWAVSI